MQFVNSNQNLVSFDDNFIDGFFDCSFMNDVTSSNFSLVHSSSAEIDFSQVGSVLQEQESQKLCPKQSYSIDIDFSQAGSAAEEPEFERGPLRKRGRTNACSKPKTKACRERERREKLNESFIGLSSILEPGRAAKTDKLAILNDAIRVVTQLRTEAEEYKEEQRKLQEEIECLKAEKNELREEKLALKSEKVKMEQQLKAMPMPTPTPGMVPSYPAAAYHGAANKMSLYPSYGMYPMWHYLPPSIRDTSRDHELRPPAA
ncbi:hypothetical protein RND81_12G130000 [Saponaria officinalis]|uniref:BHLH domain-containing protein n=1 Tax=Saponaria officinalis TaxID=3572 RepID=A0AAW1H9X6_SAPOF